ncbi:hypothetical protein [Lacimonas salitolerans]|uniref:PH domain-containing protein n=1 Tax=Lacimonas salitolerans TaxID=1323750 RepID=A0ABW4EHM8_9RHOB
MAEPLSEHLDPGEVLRATWRPAFAVYLRREAFVLAATALGFAPLVIYMDNPRAWALLPLVVLVDLVVFDNLGDWQRNRRLVWLLTDQRLLQIDTTDPLATRSIALPHIARMRRLLFWRLFVVGDAREIIDIAYVRDLGRLRAYLATAREGATA